MSLAIRGAVLPPDHFDIFSSMRVKGLIIEEIALNGPDMDPEAWRRALRKGRTGVVGDLGDYICADDNDCGNDMFWMSQERTSQK